MSIKVFVAPYGDTLNDTMCEVRNDCIFTSKRDDWFSADWMMTGDNPHSCFYTDIPRERRILFITEPPAIKIYAKYYLEQFGYIVSPYDIKGLSGKVIISNPCLFWQAGRHSGAMKTLQEALNYPMPIKTQAVSIITSLKHNTPYHKKRVKFLKALQRENIADCFGREFRPVDDKLDAIAPYKYHIAIENSRTANYWTEKLIDAWAGWALPIYCGDPMILEQIPDKNGIELIDVDDIEGSLTKIREILDKDIYASRLDAIRRCREWALKEADRYGVACRIIEYSGDNTPKLNKPEVFRIMLSSRKNAVYRFLHRISPSTADKMFLGYCRHKGRFWE